MTSRILGVIAFGALFSLLLPLGLVAWARALDAVTALPVVQDSVAGWGLLIAGAGLMAWTTLQMWTEGRGLPMSPFPPRSLVTGGPFALVSHPMYIGATLLSAGLSVATGSASGLWIVTPLVGSACAAMVLGYERTALLERFGEGPRPTLRLAAGAESPLSASERLSTFPLVFGAWVIVVAAAAMLPAPDAIDTRLPGELEWPCWHAGALVWSMAPLAAILVPLLTRDRTDLRRFQQSGLIGAMLYMWIHLVFPLTTEPRGVEAATISGGTIRFLHSLDPRGTASFASFRVFAFFAAAATLHLRHRITGRWLFAIAAGASACGAASGVASVVDVVSGFVLFLIAWNGQRLWIAFVRRLERVANAWAFVDAGPARILIHAVYAGGAAFIGMMLASMMAGSTWTRELVVVAVAGLVGAAALGQWLEGTGKLSRPFGFYGHIAGSVLALGAVAIWRSEDAWTLAGALTVAAPVIQAVGRLRCLVQGCCHGRPCRGVAGLHFQDERSRVAKFTPWRDVALYPTQVYSIASQLLIFGLMLRLASAGAGAAFIAGMYCILNGLTRFVEEHYRGEPQTARVGGLHSYQWMAAAMVAAGCVLCVIPSKPLPESGPPAFAVAALIGVLYAAAMGVEFPRLSGRFTRLS